MSSKSQSLKSKVIHDMMCKKKKRTQIKKINLWIRHLFLLHPKWVFSSRGTVKKDMRMLGRAKWSGFKSFAPENVKDSNESLLIADLNPLIYETLPQIFNIPR